MTPLRGALEVADRLGVAGWAQCGDAPVELLVVVNRRVTVRVRADRPRGDLPHECAFEHWFSAALPEDVQAEIAVRTADGTHLPGSPMRLAPLPPPGTGTRRPDAGAPLALVVDLAAPDAARDAASVALLSHMRALRRLGFSVVFSTLAGAGDAIHRTAGRVRVAYLHRLRPMALLAPRIRADNPGVHVVFSVADLAHLRDAREAALRGDDASEGLRAAELAAARAADAVVTHSPVEAALLERALPGLRVHWVPWAVPARPVTTPFAARRGIGFLGSFGHAPNVDAARWLLDEIMPAVWARAPVPCVLAGSAMPAWLRRRAGGPVEVLDPLPDTAALWERVRVAVAPLRFGAGVKGKVLDALAAGVPCVCTPVAAEGLALPPALVAAGTPALAAALLRLHADARANAQAAEAGLELVRTHHDEAVVERALAWAMASA